MNTVMAQGPWGITSAQFLAAYGGLCAITAICVWQRRRRALGSKAHNRDPLPTLGLYQLAMLGGGPQLAITTAATQLHQDGLLQVDAGSGRLRAAGAIDRTADPLEQAVFESVRRDPAISVQTLRDDVADGDGVRSMRTQLTAVGLLVDEQQAGALRRMWLAGALLALLGAAWVLGGREDGAAVGPVAALMLGVATATLWLARTRLLATHRGRTILERSRSERAELRRQPLAGDSVAVAALFGGGALWLASPEIASALDVPREDGDGWGGRGGRGTCASGGSWCGGACGGGGCGGGGCGG